MQRWSPQHRLFAVNAFILNNESFVATRRAFRTQFNLSPRAVLPNNRSISRWVRAFRETGNVTPKSTVGRPLTAVTPENVKRVQVSVEQNPRRSTRHRAQALGISRRRLQIILKKHLKSHPYIQTSREMSTTAETKVSNGVRDAGNVDITPELMQRAEKNRQKALLLKKAKLVAHPYARGESADTSKGKLVKVQGQRVIDSGGGFLIEEDDELEKEMLNIAAEPAPIISKLPTCEECQDEFKDSYLFQTFDLSVCDKCRDNEDKHSLITKTEAKQEYLLKDCDFDKREPPLKFIVRKNPHNARWGEMKLYLHLQVEKRALEVWETEENLLEEREKRDVKRQESKIKKFNKKVKQLRMTVRSSIYDKTNKASHVHEFGEDSYNEDDDTYTHACNTCGYEETYEKM